MTQITDDGTEVRDTTYFKAQQVEDKTVAKGTEEVWVFHYEEAKRLLAKAEDTMTVSEADIYLRMAHMHLEIYNMLKRDAAR